MLNPGFISKIKIRSVYKKNGNEVGNWGSEKNRLLLHRNLLAFSRKGETNKIIDKSCHEEERLSGWGVTMLSLGHITHTPRPQQWDIRK